MEEEQIKQTLTSLCDGIDYYLKKHNVSCEDLLLDNDISPTFHNEILNLISTNINSNSQMAELQNYHNQNKSKIDYSQDVKMLLQMYVQHFYKYFYTIENGECINRDRNLFVISPQEDIENIEKIINDNRCPLIIMKDGTCYISPNDHIDIVNWFGISENIDFKDGLRIVMYARNGNFEVSSMQGYAPQKDTFPLHITYDQADKMMAFYRYTCKKSRSVKSIDTILLTSSGLGLGKYDTNPNNEDNYDYEALRNLKVLANTFDGEEFDVSSYKNMIKPFRENMTM